MENTYALSNPFPPKSSITFSPHKPFYSQPKFSSWWLGIFGAYFEQFSLLSPDVNKNKGVPETAPLPGCFARKEL